MAKFNLKQLAIDLETIGAKYAADDNEIMQLMDSLKDLIERAKNEIQISEEERIPGGKLFLDGYLFQYEDLSEAYSLFSGFIFAGCCNKEYKRRLKAVRGRCS